MRFNLILSILAFVFLSACTTSEKSTISTDLLKGKWELKKEVANKMTLDCSDDLVKTILSIQENNYFVVYDDLEKSLLGTGVAKIQTQYTGQYEVEGTSFSMKYENEGKSFEDIFEITKCSKTELVLLIEKSNRTFHYIRK